MIKLFFLLFFYINLFGFTLNKYINIATQYPNPAKELQKYLNQILSANIKIDNTKNKNTIYILQDKKLKPDAFKIQFLKNVMIISASNDRGMFYGVYYFLEKLGCEFLTKDVEFIPKLCSFRFKRQTFYQKPRFDYREYFIAESEDIAFATKLFLNGRLGHRVWKSSKYYPKGRRIYNEFSSSKLLAKEYACSGQYEFDNPDAIKEAKDVLDQKLSKLDIKKDDYIYLQHEDRRSFCNDKYSFLKYVINLSKDFEYNFLYEAYQWSRTPPKFDIKIPKNLSIFFSTIEANFAKPLVDKENISIFKDLKEWNKFDRDIIIWDYASNFSAYLQPTPNIYILAKDIKTFSKLKNVKGVFLQGSYSSLGGELAKLRVWVFAKLLWNPNQNINFLIKKFCDSYYKESSYYIQKYILALDILSKKLDRRLFVKTSPDLKYLKAKYLNYLESILDKAYSVAKSKQIKQRVKEVYSGIDFVRVIKGYGDKKSNKSRKRLKEFLKNYKVEEFAEGNSVNNLLDIIDLVRKKSTPPKITKGLKKNRDWFEYQDYNLKLCCTKYVKDENSSDGVAVTMPGNKKDWGFQLDIATLPKGSWDVYASVKMDKRTLLLMQILPALHYGVDPSKKGVYLSLELKNNRYQDIKIATVDTNSSDDYIWISPAGNGAVKTLYVDRFFIIKKDIKKEK